MLYKFSSNKLLGNYVHTNRHVLNLSKIGTDFQTKLHCYDFNLGANLYMSTIECKSVK